MRWLYLCMTFLSTSSLFGACREMIVMRHGESTHNVEKFYSSDPKNSHYRVSHLTPKGKEEVIKNAQELKALGFNDHNIVALFVSPLPRTQETAEILIQQGLVSFNKMRIDERLTELSAGDLEGAKEMEAWEPSYIKKYHTETVEHAKQRVKDFYDSIVTAFPEGNMIVVTHGLIAKYLVELTTNEKVKFKTAEARVIDLPCNAVEKN